MILSREFYQQDALTVANNLLGKLLVRQINGQKIKLKIVETEAYIGPEDKACHAYQNKRTDRTETMFWAGGCAYVYLIYGLHYCLNIVTNQSEKPEAVLIRAGEPVNGWERIRQNRAIKSNQPEDLTNGPGKLCQALEINKEFDGADLTTKDELYIINSEEQFEFTVKKDSRINIDYAGEYADKPWRFYIADNSFTSG